MMERKEEASHSPGYPDEEPIVPWTKEQVLEFRQAQPSVSVWWVIATQVLVGLVLILAAWLFGVELAKVVSLGYGSLCVVLPSALFARGITSRWSGLGPGAAVTGFFLWEFVKIAMTIVMLMMSRSVVDDLSWPMMILGLIVTMKVYWLSFFWTPRGK
jgi:ATP synthase protein I